MCEQRPPVTFIAWNIKITKGKQHDKYKACVNHVQPLSTHDSYILSCPCVFPV